MLLTCPYCNKSFNSNSKIKLYLSDIYDVYSCFICQNNTKNTSNLNFYCLPCGHKLCKYCFNNLLHITYLKIYNINLNLVEFNRLYKISKYITNILRYKNLDFIIKKKNIIVAPLLKLYSFIINHSNYFNISLSDIYNIITAFKYYDGSNRYGLSIINNVEYIDII